MGPYLVHTHQHDRSSLPAPPHQTTQAGGEQRQPWVPSTDTGRHREGPWGSDTDTPTQSPDRERFIKI